MPMKIEMGETMQKEVGEVILWLLRCEYKLIIFHFPLKQNKTKKPHGLILIIVCSIIFKWLKYLINMKMLQHSLFCKSTFEILSLILQIVDA